MTDDNALNNVSSADSQASQIDGDYSDQAVNDAPEKMVPQSKVSKLVKGAKHYGYQKAQEELQAANSNGQASSSGVDIDSLMEKFNQTVEQQLNQRLEQWQQQQQQREEEAKRQQWQAEATRIAQQFDKKCEEAAQSGRYEDYKDVVGKLDFNNDQNLATLGLYMADFDNTGDMLYRLAQDPYKLMQTAELAVRQPQLAMAELKKLSDSIKLNEQAKQVRQPNAPLSQLKTNTNVGNGGDDWDALRNAEFLRG